MEFHEWCREAEPLDAVVPVGALSHRQMPKEVYGLLSALMLRGNSMGVDIEDMLEHLEYPFPEEEFRMAQYVVDDPRLECLSGRHKHICRIRMYDALRKHLSETLGGCQGGLLVLMMGYLFCVVYVGENDESVLDAFRESVEYARQEQDFSVHVNVSGLWKGIDKVEVAYTTTMNIENSRRFYTDSIRRFYVIPEDALDRITDTDQRTRFEQTFFQTTERICGCVQAGDVASAAQHMGDQLLKIAENSIGMPHPTAMNMTVNRFMSLLQYRLMEQDLVDWRYMAQADFKLPEPNVSGTVFETFYADRPKAVSPKCPEPYETFAKTFSYGV